jgi:hypothetical protein
MSQATNANDKIQLRPLLILILVLVIDLLSFTCILPLFPSIFDHYGAKPEQVFFHIDY